MITNITYLILCIYFESRNQDMSTKIKIGHVVMNRMVKSDKSIKDVVTKPWQFSWMNESMKTGKLPPVDDYKAYIECSEAAMKVLDERIDGKDFFGATHFYDDSIPAPYWVPSMKKDLGKFGNFYFYKE